MVQKEISRLLKLKHPNIVSRTTLRKILHLYCPEDTASFVFFSYFEVQLRDVFETEDELQLILELANGGELFERIVSRGYFTEDDAAQAVRHVLNALQVSKIHKNYVHIFIYYCKLDVVLRFSTFTVTELFTEV